MKKIICAMLAIVLTMCALSSCGKSKTEIPNYPANEFEICGLWAPREMSVEAFQLYKDAGFNIFSFTNHDDLPRTSDNQYYLGSKRTMEALKLCKEVGIDVYISYGASWFNRANEGDEYFDNAPFSTHDYYGEYKDIIKGVHINDEPNKEKMTQLSDTALIEDFKKVYPNTKYMINLIPETAIASRNYESYTEMLEHYGNDIMSKFENPYICVDCYLYSNWTFVEDNIVNNYNQIAQTAKKYGAETTFILQSSTGNEFVPTLSEADMRQQVYLALAFGADNLQYYCYSVPEGMDPQYNYCMLQRDNKTPSDLYYYIKNLNGEIQNFASAILAYDWNQSLSISGKEDANYRGSILEYDINLNRLEMTGTKHFVKANSSQDLIVSHFTSEEYGEAYMFVNFSKETEKINTADITFKDCKKVAIYGGEGYAGTPTVVELDDEGTFKIELNYGEGVFVTPLS